MAGGAAGDRRRPASAWTALWIAAAGATLAGCDDTPPPAPTPVAEVPAKPAAAPAGIVLTPQPQGPGRVVLTNDPSAPANTPLCGASSREANGIGQTLLSRQYATAGICSSFACYDPATATYIGADGYRHVCR